MTQHSKPRPALDLEIPEMARRFVLENTSIPLCAIKNERVVEVNQGWLSILGFDSPAEAVGRHLSELMAPGSWEVAQARMARRMAGDPMSPRVIYSMLHKSGRVLEVEVTGSVWPDDRSILFAAAADVTQRLQQSKALEESEKLYRTLAETVPEGVLLSDTSFQNVYANDAIQQLTGYSHDELAEGPWIVDPEDTQALELFQDAMANGTAGTAYETRVIRKDGTMVWVSVSWSPVRNVSGQVVGVHSTFTDISRRKTAEDALRDSETSLRTFINALNHPAFLADTQGIALVVNDALAERFGKTAVELTGTHLPSLLSSETAYYRTQWVRKAIETAASLEFEDQRDGIHYRHYLSPVVDANGKVTRLAWISLDMTEQHKASAALREAEERFRLLAENSSDVIWELDAAGNFTFVSGAVRQWGYEPEEWIGRSIAEFLPDDEKETFAKRFARDIRDPAPRRYEVRMLCKDGSFAWCEVSIDVVVDEGVPVKLQGIARDVTERKLSEDELRQAHTELEKAFRIQQEFLNNVTHEIRTPMTAVKGYVEMLLEGIAGPVSETQEAMLQKVLESSDNLLGVVTSLLEVARLRSGGVRLHPKACKPGDIASKAINAVTPQATRKCLSVRLTVDGPNRVGMYDEQKVAIVLTNLLSNAVKFAPRGKIDVVVGLIDGDAEFVIVDRGVGIRQADLAGVFNEFEQLDQPHRHKPSGFGLGLAIVARMIEILGGTLVVSSKRGVGTAFTIRIPHL